MSLMMTLSSSAFFLDEYLDKVIVDDSHSEAQLNFAIKNKLVSALNLAITKTEYGSSDWLTISKELAKTQKNSALALAYWYQHQVEQGKQLSKQAILWFEQAIRLKSSRAILQLSQYYYQFDEVKKARDLMLTLPDKFTDIDFQAKAKALLLKIHIYLGDDSHINEQLQSLSAELLSYKELNTLLHDIRLFDIYPDVNDLLPSVRSNQDHQHNNKIANCISSVQLFATNLNNLKYLQSLIKGFKEQQALASFICLPEPKYISSKSIDCIADKKRPITCDETLWKVVKDRVKTRHIGLMLNRGGANVHLGILYFDREDDVNVFSHELSHLLGFVDEYALVKEHTICQRAQINTFAHNIAVIPDKYRGNRDSVREKILASIPWAKLIKEETRILQLVEGEQGNNPLWELGTPEQYIGEVGVFKAETCQLSVSPFTDDIFAFKPLYEHTLLRSLSSQFPETYLKLLKAKASSYLMPSYYYNIALGFYHKGDMSEARLWLKLAASWETDIARTERILTGSF